MSQPVIPFKSFSDNLMDMNTQKERLLQILAETSFLSSPEPIYPLASGVLSQYYIDCKKALSHPEFRFLLGELVVEKMRSIPIDAIGGMELGAYPIGVAVSDAFYRIYKTDERAFIVRKVPKRHGLKNHIEGDVKEGERVLIVDDVITTGQSTIDAIHKSQEAGLVIVKAIAIIDRQEANGAQNIKNCGVDFEPLVTLDELRNLKAHVRARHIEAGE